MESEGGYEDRGSKCSPNRPNNTVETRLWPRFCSQDLTIGPDPGGRGL